MNWIAADGTTVTLTEQEWHALADAAARYDVVGGFEYNATPMVDVAGALA